MKTRMKNASRVRRHASSLLTSVDPGGSILELIEDVYKQSSRRPSLKEAIILIEERVSTEIPSFSSGLSRGALGLLDDQSVLTILALLHLDMIETVKRVPNPSSKVKLVTPNAARDLLSNIEEGLLEEMVTQSRSRARRDPQFDQRLNSAINEVLNNIESVRNRELLPLVNKKIGDTNVTTASSKSIVFPIVVVAVGYCIYQSLKKLVARDDDDDDEEEEEEEADSTFKRP